MVSDSNRYKAKKMVTKHPGHMKLRKDLGLVGATFAGVGIILGAGIYALIGEAAGIAGNSVWLSFLIGAFIAAFTGLSYAELSSMFPKDAGEFLYAEKAFNENIGWLVAFLVIFEGVVATAAVSLGFAGYFSRLVSDWVSLPLAVFALGCILVFSLVNYRGIRETKYLNIFLTIIEALGLFLIIFLGLKFIGKVDYIAMPPAGVTGILSGAALIFFAFIGFEAIVKLAEETKNARKTIPKALILSIIITTIIYVLVAIASVSILGWERLSQSTAPLADVAAAVMGSNAFLLLAVIALFSTANTVLMILVTTSRMLYGIAQRYKRIKIFSIVHKVRRTPWMAVIFIMALAMCFAMLQDIRFVAEVTNFAIFATFAIINAAVIKLRYKQPRSRRVFRIPGTIGKFPVLPAIGLVTSVFMIFYLKPIVIASGCALILLGYCSFRLVKIK